MDLQPESSAVDGVASVAANHEPEASKESINIIDRSYIQSRTWLRVIAARGKHPKGVPEVHVRLLHVS